MTNILLWLYSYLPFRMGKYIAMYDCPHSEPLHFHHDGCPSCYNYEIDFDDEDTWKEQEEYLDYKERRPEHE